MKDVGELQARGASPAAAEGPTGKRQDAREGSGVFKTKHETLQG